MTDRLSPPEGWFVFGTHADTDALVEFSEEKGEDGFPLWERPAHPDEEKVATYFQYATGNQIGGKPQIIDTFGEVTVSGVMEIVAIIERGGLVESDSVVNEATQLLFDFMDGEHGQQFARDMVGLLAEKGLLRS